ncbi:MAG: MBL fold metallo-hydrolase [Blastocatellia bacterium]|nr:MBL fold metallo-hydrolase [Blastocatellia bacterium]
MQIMFLGANGTVTGSKHVLVDGDTRVMVDCGLFQGYKQLRLRNRADLPIYPSTVDSVVLTHAHIDHSGYLPLFVRNGFSGPVYCSESTRDLCRILLPDAAKLQEEEARYANRRGYSKHHPAEPLYTTEDAERALDRLQAIRFGEWLELTGELRVKLVPAGHILGAGHAVFERSHDVSNDGQTTTVVFSGDVGRINDPLMNAPSAIEAADYLVVESTYGIRRHPKTDPMVELGDIVRDTVKRGGTVLIPAFAVGRAQSVLWFLSQLKTKGAIPDVPVFLDSPMAVNATELFVRSEGQHRLTASEASSMCGVARYINSVEDSKRLSADDRPKVIISASGMATGGRVLHHLHSLAPNPANSIVFVGYQAGGTRGADFVSGTSELKIHGELVPVRAEVRSVSNLSAHADTDELMAWLRGFHGKPRRVFITHGEPDQAEGLRKRIERELGWTAIVPEYRDVENLTS